MTTADTDPPRRWLFCSSPGMSDIAPLLQWLRQVVDPTRRDVVILRAPTDDQPVSNVETYAARIVEQSIRATIEHTTDPAAEIPSVDGYAVGARRLDPVPMSVLRAAEQHGIPGVCRHQDGYPFAQDEESQAGQARAQQVQAARDRNRSTQVRRQAREAASDARQEARRAAQPRPRGTNPVLGRRGRQGANAAGQEGVA